MYDNKTTTVPASKADTLYSFLLTFYPHSYIRRFGQEMRFVFHDLYREELEKYGKIRNTFWLSLFFDAVRSAAREHMTQIQRQGVKNYFHITPLTILGIVLLLPFLTLLGLDLLARVAQGDLAHYNKAWYAAITQSTLYREPFVLQLVLIVAPLLAVLLNIVPFVISLRTMKKPTLRKLLLANSLAVFIIGVGLGCLFIVYGHDVVPCMLHGLLSQGLGKLPQLVATCRNV